MDDRVHKAHRFARDRHHGQERRFTGENYIVHPEHTANLLFGADESIDNDSLMAALLHDVVEDTPTTLKEIGQEFGGVVMGLVEELTTDEQECRAKGKGPYLAEKMNNMSNDAFTIKLCDRLDNVLGLTMGTVPLKFKTRYIKETKYIISNIDRELTSIQKNLLGRVCSILLEIG